MSYKAKKLNENKKKKEPKDPNKFHLGRNLGTYLIMLGGIVGIILIVLILFSTLIGSTSYLQVYNNNKVSPYQDEDHVELITNPTFVEKDDFTIFDIDLVATSFDTHDAHKAVFELKVCKNDESPTLSPIRYSTSDGFTENTQSTYLAYASICLAADWVGVCKYSTSYTYITKSNIESTLEETSAKTISVTLAEDQVFPMKTQNWPVPITIRTPDAYVLLAYYSLVNGSNKLSFQVIHFTYDDFYKAGTTVPAI